MKIDIPIGKALTAVEQEDWKVCNGCYFARKGCYKEYDKILCCGRSLRQDHKNVIFKLVDYNYSLASK